MKGKSTGHAMTMPGGIAWGASISMGWTWIMAGILGWLVHRELIAQDAIGYGSMAILLSGSMLGAYIGWKKVMRKRFATALCVGVMYLTLLLGMTALFFGGQYQGVGVTALLVIGGSLLTVLMDAGHKTKQRSRYRKIRL